MNFPADLLYTPDHEWVRIEGDVATIGITDYAQSELGDIVFLDINTVGHTLEAQAVFGTVEAVKTVSDLFMPLGGEVIEVNTALVDHPELVNQDPYGEGWLAKVRVAADVATGHLLDQSAYTQQIGH